MYSTLYYFIPPAVDNTTQLVVPAPSTCYSAQLPLDLAHTLQARFCSIPSFVHVEDNTSWLVFCSSVTMVNPTKTPCSNPRVVVELTDTSRYVHLEAHFQRIKTFTLDGNENELQLLLTSLGKDSGYVLCPGLPSSLAHSVTFGRS